MQGHPKLKACIQPCLWCRSLRDLSFVDVVPLDTLLDVLATDSAPVAERVHRLLVPSYFPGPEDGPACVAALLRQCPEVCFPSPGDIHCCVFSPKGHNQADSNLTEATSSQLIAAVSSCYWVCLRDPDTTMCADMSHSNDILHRCNVILVGTKSLKEDSMLLHC